MNAEPQIKRGRKYDQVLDGARDVFMRDGYEGASVDMIAKAAGVSKATLYSYFPDKSALFIEVVRNECGRQAEQSVNIDACGVSAEEGLTCIAQSVTSFLYSPFAQRVFRICVAEADRFPQLGREFYKSGPQLLHETLVEFLGICVNRGEIEVDDMDLAADQFAELCKVELFAKMVFNIIETPDHHALERVIQGAVETFMARYRSTP
ncbi:MAG: TetR/AcrR family transcriptional regulator [Brevirhabdus sp.]